MKVVKVEKAKELAGIVLFESSGISIPKMLTYFDQLLDQYVIEIPDEGEQNDGQNI